MWCTTIWRTGNRGASKTWDGAGGGNRTIRAYSFYVTYCNHTNARTAQPAVCPPPMYKIMYKTFEGRLSRRSLDGKTITACSSISSERRNTWLRRKASHRIELNQTVIISVGADPKPGDHRPFENTKSAVAKSNANGINVFSLIHLFESEAGVGGISPEKSVSAACLRLNFFRQSCKTCSERVRGARLDHKSSSSGRVSPRRCSC